MAPRTLTPEEAHFLNQLRERIAAHGATGAELARATGLRRATISEVLNKPRLPDTATLLLLCRHLGVRLRLVDDPTALPATQAVLRNYTQRPGRRPRVAPTAQPPPPPPAQDEDDDDYSTI